MSERTSESEQTYRKTKHAEEKKKGTGDGERASQQRREKRLRKSEFSKRARKPVEMDVFGGTYSCICTSTFIQIRVTFSLSLVLLLALPTYQGKEG
jgi:hypothetical protein